MSLTSGTKQRIWKKNLTGEGVVSLYEFVRVSAILMVNLRAGQNKRTALPVLSMKKDSEGYKDATAKKAELLHPKWDLNSTDLSLITSTEKCRGTPNAWLDMRAEMLMLLFTNSLKVILGAANPKFKYRETSWLRKGWAFLKDKIFPAAKNSFQSSFQSKRPPQEPPFTNPDGFRLGLLWILDKAFSIPLRVITFGLKLIAGLFLPVYAFFRLIGNLAVHYFTRRENFKIGNLTVPYFTRRENFKAMFKLDMKKFALSFVPLLDLVEKPVARFVERHWKALLTVAVLVVIAVIVGVLLAYTAGIPLIVILSQPILHLWSATMVPAMTSVGVAIAANLKIAIPVMLVGIKLFGHGLRAWYDGKFDPIGKAIKEGMTSIIQSAKSLFTGDASAPTHEVRASTSVGVVVTPEPITADTVINGGLTLPQIQALANLASEGDEVSEGVEMVDMSGNNENLNEDDLLAEAMGIAANNPNKIASSQIQQITRTLTSTASNVVGLPVLDRSLPVDNGAGVGGRNSLHMSYHKSQTTVTSGPTNTVNDSDAIRISDKNSIN